jgi:hypothetical protein
MGKGRTFLRKDRGFFAFKLSVKAISKLVKGMDSRGTGLDHVKWKDN